MLASSLPTTPPIAGPTGTYSRSRQPRRRGPLAPFGLVVLAVVTVAVTVAGCSSAYYAAWEKLGKHKRDLLRDHVESARDEQQEASDQFADALTRMKELVGFDGGELETIYNRLNDDYQASVASAAAVTDRIGKVEAVAEDLFAEWDDEAGQITSPKLRASSRKKLAETRTRYQQLHRAMRRAEASMEPVLVQFKDQVLYLKHNLNAQAVGALAGEVVAIEGDVDRLIAEMRTAIAEADQFLRTMPE